MDMKVKKSYPFFMTIGLLSKGVKTMKRLLLCAVVLLMQVTSTMKLADFGKNKSKTPWRKNFNDLDKKPYNESVGYDLQMELWPDDRLALEHKIPSLLAHGWGSSPVGVVEYARLDGPHRIPGDAFTFNFPDASDSFNPSFIFDSSFGQEKDIKSLLVALKIVLDCGVIGCNLFGQSRGGGTVVNALAVLNSKTQQWSCKFDSIKNLFKGKIRLKILTMVKNGVVVIDTPMVTTQAGLNAHAHKIFRGMFFEKFLCNIVDKYVLPLVTRGNYDPYGPQALRSVESIPQKLKILLSYQRDDGSVGNVHDQQFAQKLSDRITGIPLFVILGRDAGKSICADTWDALRNAASDEIIKRWGQVIPSSCQILPAHNAGYITLLESGILNAFYQKNGGSFIQKSEEEQEPFKEILKKAVYNSVDMESWSKDNNDSIAVGIKKQMTLGNFLMVIGGWGTLFFAGSGMVMYLQGYSLPGIYSYLNQILSTLIAKK